MQFKEVHLCHSEGPAIAIVLQGGLVGAVEAGHPDKQKIYGKKNIRNTRSQKRVFDGR